ncbi:hypothetical protein CCE28_03670 [Anaeromicrobium sediminis]|uniref:FDX-ACB domain-containing protein n=1 Tax=Anaeromicrobium sediminis TaxID=1478221 RepID=A0A267MM21_9FIRM|nr:hypothetical protein CCE28_03670 [Anaeromicrobium sediminis]
MTLIDEEVSRIYEKISKALEEKFSGTLRE